MFQNSSTPTDFVPVFESESATQIGDQTFIEKLNVGSTKPYIELYAVNNNNGDTQIRCMDQSWFGYLNMVV